MAELHKTTRDKELYYYFNSKGEKLYCFRHKYYDDLGNRKEKKKSGFKTEKEAYKALLEIQANTLRGQTRYVEYDNMTIAAWFDTWFDTHENEWKPTTVQQRKNIIAHQIKPLIGNYKLSKLDKTTYKRAFINPLLRQYKLSTVKLFHTIFKIGINAAVDDEIISRNRFTKISFAEEHSKKDDSEENYLTAPDLNKLLTASKKVNTDTIYNLILLLSFTGLRRGEAHGLQWGDIDFKNSTLTVRRTRDNKGTRAPKTSNSYRTIIIDEMIVTHLLQYKKWCTELLFTYGNKLDKDTFIFISHQTGEPITDNSLLYALRNATKEAGVKDITPHGLRHTHATLLMSKNVNVKIIAERLGNTPQMILEIYGHALKELEEESVKIFTESVNWG